MKKAKLTIIYLKTSKYIDQISKIIEMADYEVTCETSDKCTFDCESIIYIMNSDILNDLTLRKDKIINSSYTLKGKDKDYIQHELSLIGINTPKIYDEFKGDIVYLKSKKHEEEVIKIYSFEETFKKNFQNFYLEEAVEGVETKYYFVNDKVFDKERLITDYSIIEICIKIRDNLKLEVFSIDIIRRENINYVIDLNPCPGFYKSKIARKYFIEYIKTKSNNH